METCPRCRCKNLFEDKAMNSLGRRDNNTYICNICGTVEALIDKGFLQADDVESEFVATHPRKEPK